MKMKVLVNVYMYMQSLHVQNFVDLIIFCMPWRFPCKMNLMVLFSLLTILQYNVHLFNFRTIAKGEYLLKSDDENALVRTLQTSSPQIVTVSLINFRPDQ